MTDPYGYQPQPGAQWSGQYQQQQWYQQQGQYPYPYSYPQQYPAPYGQQGPVRQRAATAVLAGVLGLVLAGISAYLEVDGYLALPDGVGVFDLPAKSLAVFLGYLVFILALLPGSLCVFLRKTAGAVLLIVGSVLALACWLSNALSNPMGGFGDYLELLFEYLGVTSVLLLAIPVLALVTVVFSALPATFRYLGGKSRPHAQTQPQMNVWP